MKTNRIALALAASAILSLGGVALAQSGESGSDLPAICTSAGGGMMEQMDMGKMMEGMEHGDAAHRDMMMGMDRMHADMMQGMMAADIDVAFVCGMIPHHQGAIDMAKAELAHGDDPWAKEMAQRVIDAQQKEIAEMLEWLEKQSE
jgi:uncharacterized protein (DUF305 family)